MKHELGEVMLEREFEAHDTDGNVGQVTLQVGRPQLKPETDRALWYCPHQIVGIGNETILAGRGEDAIEALLISLQMTHSILKYILVFTIKRLPG